MFAAESQIFLTDFELFLSVVRKSVICKINANSKIKKNIINEKKKKNEDCT